MNYQIKYIIDNLEGPTDAGIDDQGYLYVLDQTSNQIFKYENNGLFIKNFGESQLKAPIRLAIGRENRLYVKLGPISTNSMSFQHSWIQA